jgi:cytochrome c-type biogenesis protein CcmI
MIWLLWLIVFLSSAYVLKHIYQAFSNPELEAGHRVIQSATEQTDDLVSDAESVVADLRQLYQQKVEDLQQQLATGDIQQSAFDVLKTELDRQFLLDIELAESKAGTKLVSEKKSGLSLVLLLSVAVLTAGGGYFYWQWRGESADWLALQSKMESTISEGIANDFYPIESVNESLENYRGFLQVLHAQVLSEDSKNPDTVRLLANSYANVGIHDMAEPLFSQLLELPQQGEMAKEQRVRDEISAVRSLMLANDGMLTHESARRLEGLFRQNPGQPDVMYLLGLGAYNNGNFDIAITSWDPILELYDKQSPMYKQLLEMYQQAKNHVSGVPLAATTNEELKTSTNPDISSEAVIEVTVAITDEMDKIIRESRQPSGSNPLTLVVYTRGIEAPMPVAVARMPAPESWPTKIILSDADSLLPTRLLSQQSAVVLGARVAKTNDMRAQNGDLQSAEITVNIGESSKEDGALNSQLLINQVVQK